MSEAISELQDGEESSHDSEGPSSPREGPGSPHRLKSEQIGERVSSINCPESPASAVLSSRELWQLFDAIGTEMIVTRRGRRMFPAIKVELYDLKPDVSYILLMDMAPVDKYRYKYNAGWVRCFEEECAPTRLYIHPDSPAFGSHWTSIVINFYKLKLTNNQLDKQGHIIVNSMHRYQPRLHIVESDDINSFNWDTRQTFIFPGTQFTTVTAYQNDKITQLKIQTNPFAKGFRTPFSRCRSRNPPGVCGRFSLHSGSCSDSGVEDPPHPSPTSLPHSSPTSLFSPKFLLPTHESSHMLVHDSPRLVVQGSEVAAPRMVLPGWDLQQLLVPEQEGQRRVLFTDRDESPVLLQSQNGKTHILTGQDSRKLIVASQNYQKLIFPAAQKFSSSAQQEAQVTRLVVAPDGQKLVLPIQATRQEVHSGKSFVLQQQDGQKVTNGQAFLLTGQDLQQVIVFGANESAGHSAGIAGKRQQPPEEAPAARKLPCLSALQTAPETPVVLMYRPMVSGQQPQLLPTALLQPNSSRASSTTAYTIMTGPRELSNSQSASQPQVSTTHPRTSTSLVHTSSHTLTSASTAHSFSSPTVVNGLVHLKPVERKIAPASSETKKPAMDISCLTREGVVRSKTPPALLQIQGQMPGHSDSPQPGSASEEQETVDQQPQEQRVERPAAEAEARSDVVLVQATPQSSVQRVVVIGEKGEVAPQPRVVLPVAYDQQLVSMPIYRVGSALGGLKPLQVLASLPSGGTS